MSALRVSHLRKSFGATLAVQDVSFEVHRGEIFGLLGPNGAGKTTTIRMALDIFKPDAGKIDILDGPMTEEKKHRIGYMPEERGLYHDISLERCLIYLAALKGIDKNEAGKRLNQYLEKFDLADHRKKKIKELSKGMQQKAQIISTVLHGPELLIVDEPFAGLDPVNTEMVRELIKDLRTEGTTVVMSTHQMNQVEELCDRLVLINEGQNILYGELREIRRAYASGDLLIESPMPLPEIPGVISQHAQNGAVRLHLSPEATPEIVLRALLEQHVAIEKYEIATPSLHDIFIEVVRSSNDRSRSSK